MWASQAFRQAWSAWLLQGASFEPAFRTVIDGNFTAVVDEPVCYAFRELVQHFPNAKVVLTVGDSAEKWVDSMDFVGAGWRDFDRCRRDTTCRSEILRHTDVDLPLLEEVADFDIAQKNMLGCNLLDNLTNTAESRRRCTDSYQRHMKDVTEAIPPRQLLMFNVKEGWEPLCNFLEVPVPQAPFPRGDGAKDGTLNFPMRRDSRAARAAAHLLLGVLLLGGCFRCCRTCRHRSASRAKKNP